MSEGARLLIVGAGMTGSVTYHSLKASGFPTNQITVWEKARGFGGRMSVARGTDRQVADLGAQYVTPRIEAHARFVDDLRENGVLIPFTGSIDGANSNMVSSSDMVAPAGMSAIVKHFYKGATPAFQHRIASVNIVPGGSEDASAASSDKQVIQVTSESGSQEYFDSLVLTMPVPQVLSLEGDISRLLDSHRSALEKVTYSSRYGLAMFFPAESEASYFSRQSWTSKYLTGDPFVRYVSRESTKRSTGAAPVLMVHTTVHAWDDNLSNDQIEQKITTGVAEALGPDFPAPTSTKLIRWRYSQVFKGVDGAPGALILSTQPLIVVAGDALSSAGSNFDGCIQSGVAAASVIQDHAISKI